MERIQAVPHIIQSFVDNDFKVKDLKALNLVRKFIQVVSLADVSTVDGNRISQQAFEALVSNGLHKHLRWLKDPDILPPAFSTL